jgi:hypothetical protein
MKPQLRNAVFWLFCLLAPAAEAYIGPGSGLTALGSLLALVAAVVVAFFGFLWYPVKRMMRKQRPVEAPAASAKYKQRHR